VIYLADSNQKKILVTGSSGQLGTELANTEFSGNFTMLALDRSRLDITNKSQIKRVFEDYRPDFIVNAAAYTAVDKAEIEPDKARLVNHLGIENLVSASHNHDAKLIHISTDYVFDGLRDTTDRWYQESDITNPMNVYGQTKLAGEQAALQLNDSIVLRTSWVYSPYGSNFVHTMLRLASEGKDLKVVADQLGCPTSAVDIANVINKIIETGMDESGLFHCASTTDASWWDFAKQIVDLSGFDVDVAKLTTDEYPLPAKRPADTRMSSKKLDEAYGIDCGLWQDSLKATIKNIL